LNLLTGEPMIRGDFSSGPLAKRKFFAWKGLSRPKLIAYQSERSRGKTVIKKIFRIEGVLSDDVLESAE